MSRAAPLALIAAISLLGPPAARSPAFAQGASDAETRELIERLRPSDQRTRGIRMPGADAGVAAPAPGQAATGQPAMDAPPAAPGAEAAKSTPSSSGTTAPAGAAAVSITVNFASGSAVLTPKSAQALEALGRALASADLAAFGFRIEGHTDTVGDSEQNMLLSRRRAEAVRSYLMQRHGISPERLMAVGLGESQLLIPTRDQVAEPRNRRVQVVNTAG